jgi:hypothetical protein
VLLLPTVFKSDISRKLVAHSLRSCSIMNCECQRCGGLTNGKTYRVMSQDGGLLLLDLTVCYYCFLEARRLGLTAKNVPGDSYHDDHRVHA